MGENTKSNGVRTLTYKQANLLSAVINKVGYKDAPARVRAELSRYADILDKAAAAFNRERNFILLYHEGVEEKVERMGGAATVITYPPFPVRDKEKGADATFKEKLKRNKELRAAIDEQLDVLNKKSSGIKISRIMTEEEFDTIGEVSKAPMSWIELKDFLVKRGNEEAEKATSEKQEAE